MNRTCDFCDSNTLSEFIYDDRVSAGRKRLALSGLKKTVCSSCGEEYVTAEQMEHNHSLFDAAAAQMAEAVSVGHIRALRCRWDLSQRAASALFGAGESAFGKWESGQLPSGPTALLLQCALNVSGVVEFLARVHGASLPGCPELSEWNSANGAITGVAPIVKPVRSVSHTWPVPAKRIASFDYAPDLVELYGEAA